DGPRPVRAGGQGEDAGLDRAGVATRALRTGHAALVGGDNGRAVDVLAVVERGATGDEGVRLRRPAVVGQDRVQHGGDADIEGDEILVVRAGGGAGGVVAPEVVPLRG